jgi:flagellar motility protein MotE (MotC chaperone)
MIRIVGLLILFVLAFAGTLAGVLAATGNLTPEAIDRFLGRGEESVVVEESGPDEYALLADALKEREAKIAEREAAVRKEQARLETLQTETAAVRDDLNQLVTQLTDLLDEADAEVEQHFKDTATSISEMKADAAAEALQDWPSEDAARILLLIEEGQRGKILDKLNPMVASAFLQAIRDLDSD